VEKVERKHKLNEKQNKNKPKKQILDFLKSTIIQRKNVEDIYVYIEFANFFNSWRM
jgi:hypothetical protein